MPCNAAASAVRCVREHIWRLRCIGIEGRTPEAVVDEYKVRSSVSVPIALSVLVCCDFPLQRVPLRTAAVRELV